MASLFKVRRRPSSVRHLRGVPPFFFLSPFRPHFWAVDRLSSLCDWLVKFRFFSGKRLWEEVVLVWFFPDEPLFCFRMFRRSGPWLVKCFVVWLGWVISWSTFWIVFFSVVWKIISGHSLKSLARAWWKLFEEGQYPFASNGFAATLREFGFSFGCFLCSRLSGCFSNGFV